MDPRVSLLPDEHNKKIRNLYGLGIDDDDQKPLPKVPRRLYELWRRIALPRLPRDWNKDRLMEKMVVGYMMDGESIRCYLTAMSMEALQRLQEVNETFLKRVQEENRALNHEELATLGKLAEATKMYCEMAKVVMDTHVPRTKSAKEKKDDGDSPAPVPETPRFYEQFKTPQANGESQSP